jgi:large subunit ribosomal protein L28
VSGAGWRVGAPVGYPAAVARTLASGLRAAPRPSRPAVPAPAALSVPHCLRVITEELSTVAANCDVCGKGPGFGHSISHSHRRTKRRWNPNIQTVRAMVGKTGKTPKRLNVCTSCLKAGKVTR